LAHFRTVTPAYLETLKIPMRAGRGLTEHDDAQAPGVVVVSRSLADHYWPLQDPLGKRLKRGRYDSTRPWLTVVGVAKDVAETANEDNPGVGSQAIYLSYLETNLPDLDSIVFVLRTKGDPTPLVAAARDIVRTLDPAQPVYDVATMSER